MRKYFIWGWIAINVGIILALWFSLFAASFTGKSLNSYINLEWWYLFILTDLWTTNFINSTKFPGKEG